MVYNNNFSGKLFSEVVHPYDNPRRQKFKTFRLKKILRPKASKQSPYIIICFSAQLALPLTIVLGRRRFGKIKKNLHFSCFSAQLALPLQPLLKKAL